MKVRGDKKVGRIDGAAEAPVPSKPAPQTSDADLGLARPSDEAPPSLRELTRARSAREVKDVRALSDVVSFERFRAIAQDAVARVPDLEVPDSETLLRQPADRDVLALGGLAKLATEQVETLGDGWECLAPLDQRNNVSLGGPTIEKVGVGPRGIEDPLGGLEHFWRGELVFHHDGSERSSVQHGYSVLAEALRFLRFANELPGLEVDDASWARLAKIGPREMGNLGRGAQGKYLIEKPLAKMAHAVGDDTRKVLGLLREHDLLACVADGPYQLQRALFDPAEDPHAMKKLVARLVADGWNANELRDARRILRLSPAEAVTFTELALSMVAAPKDALVEAVAGIETIAFSMRLADTLESDPAMREAVDALRSPVAFYTAMFTRSELAAGSNLEVTFGIAVPRDGGLSEQIQSEQLSVAQRMLASLAGRPEADKSELAELLFRVADYDDELDPPHGSDRVAYAILKALDSADADVQMRCFEGVVDRSLGYHDISEILLALSRPSDRLKEAVAEKVDAYLAGDTKGLDVELTRLAYRFGLGDRLRSETIQSIEAALDADAPPLSEIGSSLRLLAHAEDVPEPLVQRVMADFDAYVATAELHDDFDNFPASVSVFMRAQGRDDLVQRFTDALGERLAKDPPDDKFFLMETWLRSVVDAGESVRANARDTFLAVYADGVPERMADRYKYVGPSDTHPLPEA